MTSPKLSYDCEASAIYIRFSYEDVAETVELSESVYVDIDRNGEPVGFEVLHAEPSLMASLSTAPDGASLRDLLNYSASGRGSSYDPNL